MSESTKTFRVGLLSPIHRLDPRAGRDFVGATIFEQIFETPLAAPESAGGPARPGLLTSIPAPTAGGGADVLSAPLAGGVRFSDGTPLTPEHFAASLARAEPFTEIATAEADPAGENRVSFRLRRPVPRFDLVLAQRYCEIGLEKDGELLGTGPYALAPDPTPERLRLRRNLHHRRSPSFAEIELAVYPPTADGEPGALIAAIESGEVHFTNVLGREHIGQLKGVRKWLEPGSSAAILYFNTQRPALADVRARRALALALDRGEITRLSYQNAMAFTATGLLPPMFGNFRDGIASDAKRAKALLHELGEARPRRLEMFMIYGPRPYLPQPQAVADYIREQLGELGVEVRVRQPATMEEYFREAARGDYDLALSGWVSDTIDAADYLEANLSPDCIPRPGHQITIEGNLARWENEEAARALARYRQEPTATHQAAVLGLVRDEMPLFPLMYGSTIFVYTLRLQGFKPSALGIPDFAALSFA